MSIIDWIVMLATLLGMVAYGVYQSRGQQGARTYLLAGTSMPWYVVLFGIMATQASAITFLSAPGQAYTDGMRFVQYYFGLPLAMIVISITFLPIFRKLKVYTAYEYLEKRFDRRTRVLTSLLFLLSRGLSTGISIYAPAIILSSILGWNIYLTNILTGGLLIIYTWAGGAKAIAHTQKLQFLIILAAMAVAGFLVVKRLPEGVGIGDALYLAGKSGKLNVITTDFNWKDRYNIWSGLIGGFFLALSYFGTDQSQVGRYITAKNNHESRMGLLMNGLVKIPMQFSILLIGALLFAFFILRPAPPHFNESAYALLKKEAPLQVQALEATYQRQEAEQANRGLQLVRIRQSGKKVTDQELAAFIAGQQQLKNLRDSVKHLMKQYLTVDANDTNYIFLYFVKHSLPHGLVGLLFAVIFLASWGSISAALNSLASSSMMDLQWRGDVRTLSEKTQLHLGRLHTLGWGVFCIAVAMFATRMGSLIEAVNVLGSLFYGVILGIFLVAFYLKRVGGRSVFIGACISELMIVLIYNLDVVSFLWLNVIGAVLVVFVSSTIAALWRADRTIRSR